MAKKDEKQPGKDVYEIEKDVLLSLLYEIKISNWRQVTNIANEIRENHNIEQSGF